MMELPPEISRGSRVINNRGINDPGVTSGGVPHLLTASLWTKLSPRSGEVTSGEKMELTPRLRKGEVLLSTKGNNCGVQFTVLEIELQPLLQAVDNKTL